MFCTSLRKRPEWATVPNTLLSSQNPKWKEQTLETHDLAIPLPQFHHQDVFDMFRLLVLSPTDLQNFELVMTRIQHLYHHTGGRNIGIVFLLNEKSPKGSGTITFMNLQVSLISTVNMPIIPIFSLSSLQATVSAFQRQLVYKRRTETTISQSTPATALLPFCTNNPPVPEHARNVLSDICRSIPDIARAATMEDGKQMLRHWLEDSNPGVAGDIVDFWAQEFLLD